MNALDRAISYVFPGWALRRAGARAMLREGFSATELDRKRSKASYRQLSPRQETALNRQQLANQARHLARDNSWMSGVFGSIVDNVVGTGILPQISVAVGNANVNRRRSEELAERWKRWSDAVDLSGRVTFYEQQRQVEYEKNVAGEVLAVRVQSDRSEDRGKLLIDIVESERLDDRDDDAPGGNVIVQGVEFTPSGQIAAYHIHKNDPSDFRLASNDPERIPASRVLHLFDARRPGSVRGYSRAAPVLETLSALKQYLNFELTRARVASAFALFIKKQGGLQFPLSRNEDTDSAGNLLSAVEGGMILKGGPGEEMQTGGANIHSTAFDPFVALMLRSAAVGMGVSYELLARDFTKANFSAARQAALEDRKHWKACQKLLITKFCEPIFGWFLESLVASGELPFGQDNVSRIWKPPGWEWIDPQKEVDARKEAVRAGFEAPQQVVAERGGDFVEVLQQIAEAQQQAEELGVSLDIFGPSAAQEPAEEEPDDEDEKEAA